MTYKQVNYNKKYMIYQISVVYLHNGNDCFKLA